MAMRYGMDADLGHVSYDREPPNLLGLPGQMGVAGPHTSERTAERIDRAVSGILDQAFEVALDLLTVNRIVLERSSAELLVQETLDEDALRALTADAIRPTAEQAHNEQVAHDAG